MMLFAAMFAGGCAAGGLILIVRGLIGTTIPLASLVAELHRPRNQTVDTSHRARLVRALEGRPSPRREADLAVCDRDNARWVRDRCTWALLGATPGIALTLLAATSTLTTVRPLAAVAVLAGGGIGGWLWARVDLAGDAGRARRAFRHALAAYLQLVTILMSGGAGVETAMFDAVSIGRGPAFGHLRTALTAAQNRREPPWRQLGELGQRLGIRELDELQAAMTLAGGGAQVRDSLVAKATAITTCDLAELESAAQARSESLVLPVALMFAGFLVLLGYPALAALSGP